MTIDLAAVTAALDAWSDGDATDLDTYYAVQTAVGGFHPEDPLSSIYNADGPLFPAALADRVAYLVDTIGDHVATLDEAAADAVLYPHDDCEHNPSHYGPCAKQQDQ